MVDPLPIVPFAHPASATIRLPGSKSVTNRALLLAALADGETVLRGALFSEDTEIMIGALRELGFQVESDEASATITITGLGGKIPNRQARLFVGNAGTAARFLTAFCAIAPEGTYEIDGIEAMRKRPMAGLLDALGGLGAEIESDNGHFPIRIHAHGLAGGEVSVDASASSQMLSALLMAAPFARTDCTFSTGGVRLPFVKMTLRMMAQFGLAAAEGFAASLADGSRVTIPAGQPYRRPASGLYAIEPDVTAASYFATLPLVTRGTIVIENLPPPGRDDALQGDAAYFRVLQDLGVEITAADSGGTAFRASGIRECPDLDIDFSGFSDTFLTLAAISPLLGFPVRIHGIAHTRRQETDRVAGVAQELRKLGQQVTEGEGELVIEPSFDKLCAPNIQRIDTYGDHRFAMSFAILACRDLQANGQPWLAINDPDCCGKTFPTFFRVLESARNQSHRNAVS